MANFQGIVLMGGIMLLIVSIILIIIFLKYSKSAIDWPPVTGSCPDYWLDLSGNGARCVDVHDLGTCDKGGNKHLNMIFLLWMNVVNLIGHKVAMFGGMVSIMVMEKQIHVLLLVNMAHPNNIFTLKPI